MRPAHLVRGGALLSLSHAVDLALGLVTLIVFTSRVAPETYGIYGAVLAALSVALLSSLPGMERAIQHDAVQGRYGGLAWATRRRIQRSLWGVLGLWGWAAFLAWRGQHQVAQGIALSTLVFPFLYSTSGFKSYLLGRERFGAFLVSNSLVEVGKLVFILAGAAWLPPLATVIGYFGVNALLNTLITGYYIRRAPNQEVGVQLEQVGNWLTAASGIETVTAYADRLLLSAFFPLQTLAVYSLSLSLTEPIRGFGSAAANLVFPKMVGLNLRRRSSWRKVVVGLGLVALLCLAGWGALSAALPWAIRLLFPKYSEALPMLPYMIVATALSAWGVVALQFLWSFEDLKAVYATQLGLPVLRLALLVGLVSWLRLDGLLWTRVAHAAAVNVVIVAILLITWRRYRPLYREAPPA
jgi:O-antigen/teichoic acid export membrane protein